MSRVSLSNGLMLYIITGAILVVVLDFSVRAETPTNNFNPAPAYTCCAGNRTDDFADSSLAPLWQDSSICGTVAETGGQLVLTRGSCFTDEGPTVQLDDYFLVCGDFDIQLDYDLVNWPSSTGEHYAGLYVRIGPDFFALERYRTNVTGTCRPYSQAYKATIYLKENCNAIWISTSATSGKLRIARTGALVSSYYWDGSAWVLARSETLNSGLATFGMYVLGSDTSPSTVAFDNLVLTSAPPFDGDGDGVPTCVDNCPSKVNPLQEDSDSDLVGDSCDNCPAIANFPQDDADDDQKGDVCDICPLYANPLQQYIEPGDANADNSHTLPDIIALVNYIFSKPGWPICGSNTSLCWLSDLSCRGDWNGNGNVALDDVIRGVNYVFNKSGGPWYPIRVGVCCIPVF